MSTLLRPGRPAGVSIIVWFVFAAKLVSAGQPTDFVLHPKDHVCLIGNTFAERMQHDGWLETRIQRLFPRYELVFRNLGFSGDELETRLRSAGFGSPDSHLKRRRADVIFAFFGYNESFEDAAGLDDFKSALDRFIDHTLAQRYNGHSGPQLVLFSPIAHEDLGDAHLPDGRENNRRLRLYTRAMAQRAAAKGIRFVDLFEISRRLYAKQTQPLTINGIHLNETGNRLLSRAIVRTLFPSDVSRSDLSRLAARETEDRAIQKLRRAVLDKNLHWFHRYRTVDGYSVYGGRSWLRFENGQSNREVMQREMEILDRMTTKRDRRIWSLALGADVPIDAPDVPPFLDVETNKPGPGPGGTHVYLDPEQAIARMQVADGLRVELFASEQDFPELANPVQMAFDTRGRLWVAVMPSYPHWKPGERMNDKILILDDTDGDGRADKCTVFADGLHVPTGLEFYDGGLLVGVQPDLMLLRDTDGDDRADQRTRVLHGFDSADTHHALNSFVLGPGGALYFQEGTFHRTQVETPWGPPQRNVNGGVFRYEPRTGKFDVHVAFDFANPHGHVFDRWGQDFITDATGNFNYFAAAFSGRVVYPAKHAPYFAFIEQKMRPTAASEILASRHFPVSMRGNYLLANVVGFRGILQYRLEDDGAGVHGTRVEPIVQSSDPNFRPVDMEVGPDGALYFLDWQNALIGHMQHHLRDPSRDRTHGRVYRVRCAERPLLRPAAIHGRPIRRLLDLLKSLEDRVRYRVKIELGGRDSTNVVRELATWIEQLDKTDPDYEHHVLEALWVHQYLDVVNEGLLTRMLGSSDGRARAAALRVLCQWRTRLGKPLEMLRPLARDPHPRVRLEAIRACSFFDRPAAVEVALESLHLPTDRFLDYTLRETIRTLEPVWKPAIMAGRPLSGDHSEGRVFLLNQLDAAELLEAPPGPVVHEVWLARAGVPHAHRHAALRGLAEMNHTSMIVELLAAIERIDRSDAPQAEEVLAELAHVISGQSRRQLQHVRLRLAKLASKARRPMTRRIAFASLLAADDSIDQVWSRAAAAPSSLKDLLDAIPLVKRPDVRSACHGRIVELVDGLPDSIAHKATARRAVDIRSAAIVALSATGVAPKDSIRAITGLAQQNDLRPAAVQSLGRFDNRLWPPDLAGSFAEGIIKRLQATPASERTTPQAFQELALANRLLDLLPRPLAMRLRKALGELGVHVVLIRPKPQQMQYDRTQFFVEAGKPVEILFENVDIMPHNLVITKPGTLARVGIAAERLATFPDAYVQDYVPDIPEVLLATRMLQPNESERLQFTAPRTPGDYPYVCTFPGHWRRMHGTMHVVRRLDDLSVSALAAVDRGAVDRGDLPTRSFVRQWKVREIASELEHGLRGRSLARGKQLFREVACRQCHRIQGDGGGVGPDLAEVGEKLKNGKTTLDDVLREIVEPSFRIDDRYRTRVILDVDGRVHTGIVTQRDARVVRLQTNQGERKMPVEIRVDRIEEEFESRISLMPAALLNTLTREEILDLLAYVVSNGDARHAAYGPAGK